MWAAGGQQCAASLWHGGYSPHTRPRRTSPRPHCLHLSERQLPRRVRCLGDTLQHHERLPPMCQKVKKVSPTPTPCTSRPGPRHFLHRLEPAITTGDLVCFSYGEGVRRCFTKIGTASDITHVGIVVKTASRLVSRTACAGLLPLPCSWPLILYGAVT